jgi:uncharacterized protein
MALFLSLFPLYIFGNLHCLGMCGPLVMLLGQHKYRACYFFGRLISYSLAGFIAGSIGAILHLFLKKFFLAELISLVSGICIVIWGIKKMNPKTGIRRPENRSPFLQILQRWISLLMLKDSPWSTFLFGFFTVALPCGQTLVVFSACALAGDAWIGFINGFSFALLTSPSLVIAMQTFAWFKKSRQYESIIIGCCSILVGIVACCRGLAEMGWIDHWVINPDSSNLYHLVIF